MHGVADSVRRVTSSSVVTVAVTAGDLAVTVESARLFPEPAEGETLPILLDGQTVYYSDIQWHDLYGGPAQDTLTLTAGAPDDAAVNAPVKVPGTARFVAMVYLADGLAPVPAVVPHNFINKGALRLSEGGLGTTVEVREDDSPEGWRITEIIDQDPTIDGNYLLPSTAQSTVVDLSDPNWTPLVTNLVNGSNSMTVDGGDAAARHHLIKPRGDSDTNAASDNPVLVAREIFITDDGTNVRGFWGDGTTAFNSFAEPRGIWATPADLDAGGGGSGGDVDGGAWGSGYGGGGVDGGSW
jgi:hypothetical protein